LKGWMSMKLKELVALLLLAALWGASFLFIRIASPLLGPFLTIEGRVSIAAFILLVYAMVVRVSVDFKKWWKQYLIIGALNAAIPFTLIAAAELHLTASMTAVLNSLTPLCTALAAWLWLGEKLTFKKYVAICTGTVGVIVLVGWSPQQFTAEMLLSVVFSILSAVSYGFAGVYAKRTFSRNSPLSLAIGQQAGASILLLPLAFIGAPDTTSQLTPTVIYSVLGLAVFCTAIAYLLYFYLITSIGPVKTLSVTFLVPLFGILWSFLFLREPFTLSMVVGLLLILSSMLLISDIRLTILKRLRLKRETSRMS
jgi:drug/metabolite transporter (DMT)-like permease